MNRNDLQTLWDNAWDGGSWVAPWKKAVEMTASQAAWRPTGGPGHRHTIWQIVSHVIFWREVTTNTLAGKPRPDKDTLERRNFPEPVEVTDTAWRAEVARLEESHRQIAAAIADPAIDHERLRHHLYHDAYHLGQVMYVRAMQGMGVLE